MQLLVIKRNFNLEAFSKGRVALAVFKAMKASGAEAGKSRDIAGKVSEYVEELALSMKCDEAGDCIKVDLEWIQDEVVKGIEHFGEKSVSKNYQKYREGRDCERSQRLVKKEETFQVGKSICRKKDFYTKIIVLSKVFGVEFKEQQLGVLFENNKYDSWASVLEGLLDLIFNLGQNGQLLIVKEIVDIEGYISLIYYNWRLCLKIEFNWLDCLEEKESITKEIFYKKEFEPVLKNYIKRKIGISKQGKETLSPSEGLEYQLLNDCLEELDLNFLTKEYCLGFSGQKLLNNTFNDLAAVIFLKAAQNLFQDKDKCLELFKLLITGEVVFPILTLKSIVNKAEVRGFERALFLEDKTEEIFSGLLRLATLIKEGNSVSIDISRLRGKGVAVGKDGNVSAGIEPVLNMIAQTGAMLSGVNGDQQKARVFIEVWHWDLERFLSFARKEADSEIIRTAVLLSDVFMRHVIDGKDWLLGTPEELEQFFSAKSISERQEVILDLIEKVKHGKMPGAFLKIVPARTVFNWICSAIAAGAGTSIVFKDTCKTFDLSLKGVLPSTRLGALLLPNEEDQIIEVAINFSNNIEKNIKLLGLAESALIKPGMKSNKVGLGICILGDVGIDCVSKSISNYFDLHGKAWDSNCFWGLSNPWESFKKGLYQSRGGYLETIGSSIAWKTKNGPNMGRFLLQTPREEYLLLSKGSPKWFSGNVEKQEYEWKRKKIVFKRSNLLTIQEQAARASEWQTITDQTVTWDVFVNEIEEQSISEAIRTGWIYGLHVVRRFVKINGL